ncbi:MAG TPA: right-handed parallel beta-helix repeat-containing protein [Phycisphaerae bacterium]
MNARPKAIVIAVCAVGVCTLVLGGNLNPPPGPVAPTMKALDVVEPRTLVQSLSGSATALYVINSPGAYYLTGDVVGVNGKHGIEIAASGVTLDLNGFDLLGVAGSLDGVSTTVGGLTSIAVVNGSVRNWGDEGVDLATSAAINCRVADLLASGNAGNGMFVGAGSTVSNCSVSSNTVTGISTNDGSTVSNCSAFSNTGIGISTSGGTVADCTARQNTLDGIVCFSQCVIRGNTCSSNGSGAGSGAGIHATNSDNRIESNNCTGSDRGIDVDAAGNFITRNICSGNTTNWDVVAGNVCLVVQGVTGAAILGNTGGVAPGSTDPNANFTY